MDTLSYMLHTLRMRSAVYATVRLSPPWGVGIPQVDAAAFHGVIAGGCWLRFDDEPPVALAKGDVVVLPHGGEHAFFDAPGSPVRSLAGLYANPPAHRVPVGPIDVDPAATTVVCGHLWFDDQTANPLVAMLPRLLHFRAAQGGRPVGWLEPMLAFVALETNAQAPGAEALLARLADVIVIQTIRDHLPKLPPGERGWLRALADPQLGDALGLIHQHPDSAWTVGKLADKVGLSRSGFAARFTDLVGEPPLTYLTRWRMHHAQRLLRAGNVSITEIARRSGYQTEPAFSRTFKRWTGVAPGVFRRNAHAE